MKINIEDCFNHANHFSNDIVRDAFIGVSNCLNDISPYNNNLYLVVIKKCYEAIDILNSYNMKEESDYLETAVNELKDLISKNDKIVKESG